jgi:uncharacterized LabA/DUF88 family protein
MSIATRRAVLFIDNAYLSAVRRLQFESQRLNYLVLSNLLTAGYERLRTYVYDAWPYQGNPPTEQQRNLLAGMQSFVHAIEQFPSFEVRMGAQRPRGTDYVQKGVDVLLAVDMTSLALKRQIQKAVLIAGDADYVPVVDAVKDEGVSVTLYHAEGWQIDADGRKSKPYSAELWSACDERYPLTRQLIDQVKM